MKATKLPQRNTITTPRVQKKLGSVPSTVSGAETDELTAPDMATAAVGGASIMADQNLGAAPQDNKNKFQAPKKAQKPLGVPSGLSAEINNMQKNKKPGVY